MSKMPYNLTTKHLSRSLPLQPATSPVLQFVIFFSLQSTILHFPPMKGLLYTLNPAICPVQMSTSYTKLALTSPKWALMTIALCWHLFHSGSY